MGQKANPVALRVQSRSRFFDSNWYNDSFYTTLLLQDISLRHYFNTFLKALKLPSSRCGIRHLAKNTKVALFLCYPHSSRDLYSKYFGLSQNRATSATGKFFLKKTHGQKSDLQAWSSLGVQRVSQQNLYKLQGVIPAIQDKKLLSHAAIFFKSFQKLPFFSPDLPSLALGEQTPSLLKAAQKIDKLPFSAENPLKGKAPNTSPLGESGKDQKLTAFLCNLLLYKKHFHQKKKAVGAKQHGKMSTFFQKSQSVSSLHKPSLNALVFLNGVKSKNSTLRETTLQFEKDFKFALFFRMWYFLSWTQSSPKKLLSVVDAKKKASLEENSLSPVSFHSSTHGYTGRGFSAQSTDALLSLSTSTALTPLQSSLKPCFQTPWPPFVESDAKYKNYMESTLSSISGGDVQVIPFQIQNEWQHAGYLADEIVYFLEKRVDFRRIKMRLLKKLSTIEQIQGIRIQCSGRVGGKSKKAQRAKMESFKYGQTCLQVFSSQIDFAARTAFTVFGCVGVKVWICYKH
jgi:ribosomal protein S3